jgi:hypothetical protein
VISGSAVKEDHMDTRGPIALDIAVMPAGHPRDAFTGLFLPSAAVDEAQVGGI